MFKDIRYISYSYEKKGRIFHILDSDFAETQEILLPDDDKRLCIHVLALIKFYKTKEKILDNLFLYFSEFINPESFLGWAKDSLGDNFKDYYEPLKEKILTTPSPKEKVKLPVPVADTYKPKRGRR